MIKFAGLFWSFFALFSATAYAQAPALTNDLLFEKLDNYAKAHPSALLFVHTDKTLYTNNETIWFSAYLVQCPEGQLKDHTVLSAALINENGRQVCLQEKYVMEDGLSFGSLVLPDSIAPGNYQLTASSNVLDKEGNPLAVFARPLTIKSITQPGFTATLTLRDSLPASGPVQAEVLISAKEGTPLNQVRISYNTGDQSVKVNTRNGQNSYLLSIPREQLRGEQPVLTVSVTYRKEVQHLSVKLPSADDGLARVRFFPEGGNLVSDLDNLVGWETTTVSRAPISLSGVLYCNGRSVDTISTNSSGTGTFRLKPGRNDRYTFRPLLNGSLKKDSIYTLPPVLENGLLIHLDHAVVNDTLRLSFLSKQERQVQVLIHNYQTAYASIPVHLKLPGSRLSIVLPALPKGLATLTVLDDQGRPLAERLFFAHYDQRITAEIKSSKPEYNKRQQVPLKLRFTDQTGNPVSGIVSLACVQDNRIEGSKNQDIESYVYLEHELGRLPDDPQGRAYNHPEYLESILLIKGWRRYTWQDVMKLSLSDTVQHVSSPEITGRVLYYSKPLKKPVTVSILRDSLIDILTTNNDGTFKLNSDQLVTEQGRKVLLMVNKEDKRGYTIEVEDPLKQVVQRTAGQIGLTPVIMVKNVESSSMQQLSGFKNVIALKEVKISAPKRDLSLFETTAVGPNSCGDYVCRYGFLNCPFHGGEGDNTQPVKGKSYRIYPNSAMTYGGCMIDEEKATPFFKVNGIYTTKEFYGVENDPLAISEPQYLSTLFWKPGIMLDENGEAGCSFLTGDITGKFRIVVQGLSNKDMIYGEQSFTVK